MTSIPAINPAITENMEWSIIKARILFINLKVDMLLEPTLHFTSSYSNMLGNIPSEE